MAELLRCFFMHLPGKGSEGVNADISAALYFTVTRKQASKIVFLRDLKDGLEAHRAAAGLEVLRPNLVELFQLQMYSEPETPEDWQRTVGFALPVCGRRL